jgi:hypothetical protein
MTSNLHERPNLPTLRKDINTMTRTTHRDERSDLSEESVAGMEIFLSVPPGPLGLHNFVDNFIETANNLVRDLSSGRLRAVRAVIETR